VTSAAANLRPELQPLSHELKLLQAEIQGRERAKTCLLTYASSIEIPGAPVRAEDVDPDCEEFRPVEAAFGEHQLLWLSCLQKIEDGKIKRLLGLMPPGSAKSTYSSIVFPTHYMGRFPGSLVITVNYGSDLPRKWGRKGRSIIRQKQYRRIFDTQLASDSQAADEWALTNGSEYMGAGLLAGITGNRADGVIWDDLIKGREQADSDVVRNKTWDAYFDDLLTRKKPNAWEIGVTTRWHEDDPAGRILPENYNGESGWIAGRDGNDWYVVCIPAEADRADDILGRALGERIWPEWFPPDHFKPFKRNARTWNALYQQRPAPEEGDYFKREWIKPCTMADLPPLNECRSYGASDYAVTSDGGDYTCHGVLSIDPQERMYLRDIWREQKSSDKWVDAFCDLVLLYHPIGWAEEQGQIKSGVGPFLDRRQRERKAYVARDGFPTRGDKSVRAQSMRGRMAQLGLYVPTDAPWFPAFLAELLSFPAGKHDDQVDMLGLLGQLLDKMTSGVKPAEPEKPKNVSGYKAAASAGADSNWKVI
jgi:predicted phage terminase large subunit-like protein